MGSKGIVCDPKMVAFRHACVEVVTNDWHSLEEVKWDGSTFAGWSDDEEFRSELGRFIVKRDVGGFDA
ncbi:MAG: hypothetical protein LKE37_05065 [Atopobiaceae bacterium]|nr:hypothetical protein [Atopobiaceae bacterium]